MKCFKNTRNFQKSKGDGDIWAKKKLSVEIMSENQR